MNRLNSNISGLICRIKSSIKRKNDEFDNILSISMKNDIFYNLQYYSFNIFLIVVIDER